MSMWRTTEPSAADQGSRNRATAALPIRGSPGAGDICKLHIYWKHASPPPCASPWPSPPRGRRLGGACSGRALRRARPLAAHLGWAYPRVRAPGTTSRPARGRARGRRERVPRASRARGRRPRRSPSGARTCPGPAKRSYTLTDDGRALLDEWLRALAALRDELTTVSRRVSRREVNMCGKHHSRP